jgi:hypothetical protein
LSPAPTRRRQDHEALRLWILPALIAAGPARLHKLKVTLVYEHALPNVPGKASKASSSNTVRRRRRPACPVSFIYATVLEGAIKSAVNDGPVVTYRAARARNAGRSPRRQRKREQDRPAKLLAVFVVNRTRRSSPPTS